MTAMGGDASDRALDASATSGRCATSRTKYGWPRLTADEQVLFTQRGYFPFPGTSLSALGVLLVLTDLRLLFAPRRLMGIPALGESVARARSVNLRDIAGVGPVGTGALEIRTRFGDVVPFCVLPPEGISVIWSVRRAGPYRDETVRRIEEACSQFRSR